MSTLSYQSDYRRYLPHIQPPGAVFFVTFRLAGTIPATVQAQLIAEVEAAKKRLALLENPVEQARQTYLEHRRAFGRFDAILDKAAHGPTWLKDPRIARLVTDSLHFWDGKRYDLDCYSVMSNHGHVVFRPLMQQKDGDYFSLALIMYSIKRYTATEANRVLGRNGRFWQPESYDHVVRDEAELLRIRRYVLENPVKAGLVAQWEDWPWSWCNPGY
ncbi:MAG: hypothetical protein IAE79_08905 [Anaerolinea sp.]|nr:hypothetical protein [Anaerolinea sp.]